MQIDRSKSNRGEQSNRPPARFATDVRMIGVYKDGGAGVGLTIEVEVAGKDRTWVVLESPAEVETFIGGLREAAAAIWPAAGQAAAAPVETAAQRIAKMMQRKLGH